MKTLKQHPVAFYLVLLALLSIYPYVLMIQAGDSESDLATFLLMWTPALAAIVQRLLTRQSVFRNVGWNPIKSLKWFTLAMLIPLMVAITAVGLQVLFGFAEFNSTFIGVSNGEVDIHGVAMLFGAEKQHIAFFIFNFLLSFFVGNLLYMIAFALGEEYGWRAHLQALLSEKYSLPIALILLGIIWGLWHFPGIWLGHNYPHYPLLGSLILMPLTCIAFSFAFGIAYIKAKSLWVPVMFHSALNLASGMDDKMITSKLNTLGADLVWTGLWIGVALLICYFSQLKHKEN